jgi:hypothetical protein
LDPNNRLVLVATVGRIGPPGKQAVPFLRKILERPRIPPQREAPTEVKLAVWVALANLGDTSKDDLAEILAGLKSPVSELSRAATRALILVRPGDWVTKDMIGALAEALDPYPYALEKAVALGVLGQRASAAGKRLEELQQEAGFPFALAISRIEPRKREAELRRVCTSSEQIGGCKAVLVMAAIYWCNAPCLLDGPAVQELVKLMDDPDPKVSEGAIWMLQLAGLGAREAVPDLLRFMRRKAEEGRRAYAAYALSRIADACHLPALKAALAREKSAAVRQELAWTLHWVETLQPTPGRTAPTEFAGDWLWVAGYRATVAWPSFWRTFPEGL